MKFLLIVLGVVLVIEGIPWFLSPRGVLRALLVMARSRENALRAGGLALMSLGLLLVYIGVYHLN